jgi:SAM-dependent methyltransferase
MAEFDKNKKTVEAYDKNPQFYGDKFDDYGPRTDDIDRAIRLNESGSQKVLELGCANGRDAQYVISKAGIDNYTGIDASEGLIMLAREKNHGAVFQVKDIRDVSYETGTFGLIFIFATLLHLKREEVADLLLKVKKWLKKGGIVYITSKYGDYREIPLENMGDLKYYYSYTPEDIIEMAGEGLAVAFNTIGDSDYGPSFTVALRKI